MGTRSTEVGQTQDDNLESVRTCGTCLIRVHWGRHNVDAMARRLLLVENCEDNICQKLAGIFQTSGFETELATTPAGCMEAVRTRATDVVLMITNNIHNPPAFEVAEAIRTLQPNCGFVFLAGSEQDGREPFLTAGYEFRVYPIPLPIPELLTLTSEAVNHPANTFITPKKNQEPRL